MGFNSNLSGTLNGLSDLFKTSGDDIEMISVDKIHDFKNHPFRIVDDDQMKVLVASIKESGVLNPVIVRNDNNGGYEMISGHRRLFAAKTIGNSTIPAYVKDMDDDTATIAMVDSNIQRENILPSEKGFAYKMKLEAIRKTRTSDETGRSDEILAAHMGDSARTIQRYIRLTYLRADLRDLVDIGKINLQCAYDISFLNEEMQLNVLKHIENTGRITPDVIELMKSMGEASYEEILKVLEAPKEPVPLKKITFKKDVIKFFPPSYTEDEIRTVIVSLLKEWAKNTYFPS